MNPRKGFVRIVSKAFGIKETMHGFDGARPAACIARLTNSGYYGKCLEKVSCGEACKRLLA
jgi:hypothetical protein